MMRKIFSLCATLGMMALAGCSTYSLEELRHTEKKGNDFQKALAQYYMDFAEELEKNYDWNNSWHFADKGLLAAYGQEIGPEDLSEWNIADDAKPELEKGRAALLAALTSDNIEKQPELAAKAQFNFDCWVMRAEQVWQTEAIAECREDFAYTLSQLVSSAREQRGELGEKSSYIVFFEWGQASLTNEATKTVDNIAAELAQQEGYEVVVNGHTDTSGGQKYNMKLSLKRAGNVKNRLVAGGVPPAVIEVFAYGETDLALKTSDGKKEKTNRRVEIFIND